MINRLIRTALVSALIVAVFAASDGITIDKNLRFPAGEKRVIAVTFDDGPHPDWAPVLMDAMNQVGWKATFCVLGKNVASHPTVAQRMVAEDHELANHSWDHADFSKLDLAEIDSQLSRTHAAILAATQREPHYFRPPYLRLAPGQAQHIHEAFGYQILSFSVDSGDWRKPPSGETASRLLAAGALVNGDIVLAHEWNIQEMPDIIIKLAAAGWTSVTVSELRRLKDQAAATP